MSDFFKWECKKNNSQTRYKRLWNTLKFGKSIFSDFFYQNKALIKIEDIMPNHHQQSTYSSWKDSARTFCYWYFWLRFIEGTTIQCWRLAHICCSKKNSWLQNINRPTAKLQLQRQMIESYLCPSSIGAKMEHLKKANEWEISPLALPLHISRQFSTFRSIVHMSVDSTSA